MTKLNQAHINGMLNIIAEHTFKGSDTLFVAELVQTLNAMKDEAPVEKTSKDA